MQQVTSQVTNVQNVQNIIVQGGIPDVPIWEPIEGLNWNAPEPPMFCEVCRKYRGYKTCDFRSNTYNLLFRAGCCLPKTGKNGFPVSCDRLCCKLCMKTHITTSSKNGHKTMVYYGCPDCFDEYETLTTNGQRICWCLSTLICFATFAPGIIAAFTN